MKILNQLPIHEKQAALPAPVGAITALPGQIIFRASLTPRGVDRLSGNEPKISCNTRYRKFLCAPRHGRDDPRATREGESVNVLGSPNLPETERRRGKQHVRKGRVEMKPPSSTPVETRSV